jgi:transcriptional regulator with XRE-family HTH domain
MSEAVAKFGAAVRRLREQSCLSQEQLAHRADVNRSYLGEVERGAAVPSLTTMAKLAVALHVRLSDLVAQSEADETC